MADRKTEELKQRAHERMDRVMDKAEELNMKGKETIQQMKAKMMAMREDLDDKIRRNPESSVLIAAGAGVLIGAVLTAAIMRRRRH